MIATTPVERAGFVLDEALARYGGAIALACSFGGPSGMVLLDMVARRDPRVPVYYLDTGLLFDETYALVGRICERYGIEPIAVRPELSVAEQNARYGDALWARDPDACCALRKVEPQHAFLAPYRAWITGIRRDGGATREAIPTVAPDPDSATRVKIAPLADWTSKDIWSYISSNDVPYNPLNDVGYPSVGCTHCTRAIVPGEDVRAGRWSGFAKTECGLHAPAHESGVPR
ncbi:MAG: phosphoadenylyl-sulfate reductase [Vulcanimicrobiaceae bacterium]